MRLSYRWRWLGAPQPVHHPALPKTPKSDASAPATERLEVVLNGAGEMRCRVAAKRFPLLEESTIVGWDDRLGLVLEWPKGSRFRVLPPGSLASLIEDQRVDVMPTLVPTLKDQGQGRWNKQTTHRSLLKTPEIELEVETVAAPDAGRGAIALCRMLSELGRIAPANALCDTATDQVIVTARYRSLSQQDGNGIEFSAENMARLREPAKAEPPTQKRRNFVTSGGPIVGRRHFASPNATPTAVHKDPHRPTGVPNAAKSTLSVNNRSTALIWLFVDGHPRLSLPPDSVVSLSVASADKMATWRSYLGTRVSKPFELPRSGELSYTAGVPVKPKTSTK